MKIINRQSRANEAHRRWRTQYPSGVWGVDKERIHEKLVELGNEPDADAVDAIIGNGSWTNTPPCNECGSENIRVVRVGEPLDHESATACLCEQCIRAALSEVTK